MKKKIDSINCRCDIKETIPTVGSMFDTKVKKCKCQITNKKGTSPDIEVKRIDISIN